MRRTLCILSLILLSAEAVAAQGVPITGQVFVREGGQPLGYAAITAMGDGTQILTGEAGTFTLRNVPPGELRLRFKRIGFAPKDTTISVTAEGAPPLRVELSRLVLRLPTMVVSGRCTDSSPVEGTESTMEQLFDQVRQNAERVRLIAESRPFEIEALRVRGMRDASGLLIPTEMKPITRAPVPDQRYIPRQVVRRGTGAASNEWHVLVPELADFADSTFTNNHCFQYAGQTDFFGDSVIRVDYKPVPWLEKEVDIHGSIFLAVDGYQLVGTITKLNRIPGQFRRDGLREFTVTARFSELVPGIPVLFHWELANIFRPPTMPRVETGEVTGIKWRDSTAAPGVRTDSVRSPR